MPIYVNDDEPVKKCLAENQRFMILDCPGFDWKNLIIEQMRQNLFLTVGLGSSQLGPRMPFQESLMEGHFSFTPI